MKTSAIIRIILWSILVLVLVGILVLALTVSWTGGVRLNLKEQFSQNEAAATAPLIQNNAGNEDTPSATERVLVQAEQFPLSFSAEEVQELKIGWARGSVSIVPGGGEEITVEETTADSSGETTLFHSLWKGELKIYSSDPAGSLGDSSDRTLTITVPVDWVCRELEVETNSAQLNVRELTISDAEYDTSSGSAVFENCIVDSLSVDTASGNVSFSGTLKELDMDSASGDFTGVLTDTPKEIEMDSASGSLDLTLPEDCGFTLSMEALSSDLVTDFETQRKGNQYVYGDGRCSIEIESMSGDVTVRKPKA